MIGPGCDLTDSTNCDTPQSFSDLRFCNNDPTNCNCPYYNDIVAGIISGHPDFNIVTGGSGVDTGPPTDFYSGLSFVYGTGGETRATPIADRFAMQETTSGLLKPLYCSDNTLGVDGGPRCGHLGDIATHFQTVSSKTNS